MRKLNVFMAIMVAFSLLTVSPAFAAPSAAPESTKMYLNGSEVKGEGQSWLLPGWSNAPKGKFPYPGLHAIAFSLNDKIANAGMHFRILKDGNLTYKGESWVDGWSFSELKKSKGELIVAFCTPLNEVFTVTIMVTNANEIAFRAVRMDNPSLKFLATPPLEWSRHH